MEWRIDGAGCQGCADPVEASRLEAVLAEPAKWCARRQLQPHYVRLKGGCQSAVASGASLKML